MVETFFTGTDQAEPDINALNDQLETNGQKILSVVNSMAGNLADHLSANGEKLNKVVKRMNNSLRARLQQNTVPIKAAGAAIETHLNGFLSQNEAALAGAMMNPEIADYLKSNPLPTSYQPGLPAPPPEPPTPTGSGGACQPDGTWGPVWVWADHTGRLIITQINVGPPTPGALWRAVLPSLAEAIKSVQGAVYSVQGVPDCGGGGPPPPVGSGGRAYYAIFKSCTPPGYALVPGDPQQLNLFTPPPGWETAGSVLLDPAQAQTYADYYGQQWAAYCARQR